MSDRRNPSVARDRAKIALRAALASMRPEIAFDAAGYCVSADDNLVSGLTLDDIRHEFDSGAGAELRTKFRAPHSSSALAVNAFAALRKRRAAIDLAGGTVWIDGFEVKQPTGLPATQPPHLDVIAAGHGLRVAIESKCLEPLTPKRPAFSSRYRLLQPRVGHTRWFAEMVRIIDTDGTTSYRHLDAAQLIKHAFGLLAHPTDLAPVLLYLFWEPIDAADWPVFAAHRRELAAFAERVAGDSLRFAWASYPDLWKDWRASPNGTLNQLAATLADRYLVSLDCTPRPLPL